VANTKQKGKNLIQKSRKILNIWEH
jgi:hypothetical protein